MTFKQWLRNLFGVRVHALRPSRHGKSGQSPRLRSVPRVEFLDDRLAPALFVVTSLADSGAGTLRQAITDSVSNGAEADFIAFAPSLDGGTINLTTFVNDLTAGSKMAGPSAFFINNTPITINGQTGLTQGITIARSGAAAFRLFDVSTSGNLTLIDLTVSGGLAQGFNGGDAGTGAAGGGGAGLGGAIFNRGALTILNSTLTGNTALGGAGGSNTGTYTAQLGGGGGGGGLGSAGGVPYYFVAGDGGGPNGGAGGQTQGGLPLPTAGGFGGGGGGGRFTGGGNNDGAMGGFGGGGGGGGRLSGNLGRGVAGGFGGGGGGGPSSPAGFTGPGGYGGGAGGDPRGGGGAGMGGAIFNEAGTVVITNSTISGNTATGGAGAQAGKGLGGGLFNHNGTITITNSTISGNTADQGARGILTLGDGATANATITNTIIGQNNTTVSDLVINKINSGSATVSGATNLIRTTTVLNGATNSLTGTVTTDPLLGPLQSNGGRTRTMALLPGSPAINAGTVAGAPAADQRGVTRLGTPDIGAFESPATVTSIARTTPSGAITNATSVTYTVTFSSAVTGLTAANFDLSGTAGVADTNIGTPVTGNGGLTWTVTVTGLAGTNGALVLNLVNNTGLSQPLTNLPFAGDTYTLDHTAPTATVTVSDTALRIGETATVTFTFSEAVTGFTTADLSAANGVVTGLSTSDGGVTWTATLTPTAGITDTTNLITLDLTGVQDLAGNLGAGTADSNNYAIDTQRPTATATVSDAALKIGETSLVTFTFSEAVTGFTTADLSAANGVVTGLSTSDGGVTWTATLTPTAGITDTTNLITLDLTGVQDLAGNLGAGTADSNNYAIDTQRPTATATLTDTALKIGDTATVTFTFSEAVTGFTTADLTVANGAVTGLSSSDGGVTWTGTFTPDPSVTDATNVITVDLTGVTDLAGNAGAGTADSNNYAIDTQRPTATATLTDTALKIGDTATVTFTFSEAVTGFTTADLSAANGVVTGLSSSDGGVTWTGTFTPDASVTDATNVITVDLTGVTDLAGNAGAGTADSNNYAIDTQRPTATATVSDAALKIGETSLVTFTFSEAVTGFTTADLSAANGVVTGLSSSDGGVTWTGTFTPDASVTDATNVITVDLTGVTDLAGNAGAGTADSNNYAIDTQRPTATATVSDAALKIGETSLVTFTFSEAVTGFTTADLTVANGAVTGLSTSDGGVTWTATFTPDASVTDATNVITVDLTGVTDLAGNAGAGTADSINYAIDTQRPTATITSTTPAGTSPISVTVTFSESVTGFNEADVVVGNGTVTNFAGSGTTYTFDVVPFGQGTVTVDVGADAGQDAAGNGNTAASQLTRTFDTIRPTVTISPPSVTFVRTGGVVRYTITYADANFDTSTLTSANIKLNRTGTANGTIVVTGTGKTRTVTIRNITGNGSLSISILAGTATDKAGNKALAAGPSKAFSVLPLALVNRPR